MAPAMTPRAGPRITDAITKVCGAFAAIPGLIALAEIERGHGTVYDAGVVDACLRLFRDKGCQLPA